MTTAEQELIEAGNNAALQFTATSLQKLQNAAVNWRREKDEGVEVVKEHDRVDARRLCVLSLSIFAKSLNPPIKLPIPFWFYIGSGSMVPIEDTKGLPAEIIAEGQRLGIIEKANV